MNASSNPELETKRPTATAALCLALLLGAALLIRGVMLLRTDRYLDADESVVGLMARHIRDRGEHPAFFYGQHYGGGHSVSAHLTAAIGEWVPIDAFSVQLSPVLFSLALGALVYFLAAPFYGRPAALAGSGVALFAPAFLRSSLKADGYMETLFFSLAAVFLLFVRVYPELERGPLSGKGRAALAGALFFAGCAFWCYEFSAPMTALALAFGLPFGKRFVKPAAALTPLALLGAAPLIGDNLQHGFANVKHLLGMESDAAARPALARRAIETFSRDLPAFFGKDAIHNWADPVPPESRVYFFAVGVTLALAWSFRGSLARKPRPGAGRFEGFLFSYPALYLALYIVSPFAGASPRYLLPLEPLLSLAAGAGIVRIVGSGRPGLVPLGLACALAAGGSAAIGISNVLKDDAVIEGNVATRGEDLAWAADFLADSGQTRYYATYFVKWRLLFESGERLHVANMTLSPGDAGWGKEEKILAGSTSYGYAFHALSPHAKRLMDAAKERKTKLEAVRIGDYLLAVKMEPQIAPADLMGAPDVK